VYGNALSTIAGFLFASKLHIDLWLFIPTVVGTSLVIGSACAVNNRIDLNIDKKMARTSKRALVSGEITTFQALIFAFALGLAGFTLLALFTNLKTFLLGVIGLFFYLVMYSIWKRKSTHGTLVGSVSGAIPPVAGYTAVTNRLDKAALLIFLIMVFWQMAHFFSIAMRRKKDYEAALLPVLPVKKGTEKTKKQILFYIFAFILASILLTLYDYVGYSFLIVVVGVGGYWLLFGLTQNKKLTDEVWSKKMFLLSLIALITFCVALSFGALLP
jgi:protoheme IX farnesyltransferase